MRDNSKIARKIGGLNLKSSSEKYKISTEILKIFEELVRGEKDE